MPNGVLEEIAGAPKPGAGADPELKGFGADDGVPNAPNLPAATGVPKLPEDAGVPKPPNNAPPPPNAVVVAPAAVAPAVNAPVPAALAGANEKDGAAVELKPNDGVLAPAVAGALAGVAAAAIFRAKSADVSLMPCVSQGRADAGLAGLAVGVAAAEFKPKAGALVVPVPAALAGANEKDGAAAELKPNDGVAGLAVGVAPPPAAAFWAGVISTGLIPCVSHGRAEEAGVAAAGFAAGACANGDAGFELKPCANGFAAAVDAVLAGANEKEGAAAEFKPKAGALVVPVPAALAGANEKDGAAAELKPNDGVAGLAVGVAPPPAAAFWAGVISTGLIPCVSHGRAEEAGVAAAGLDAAAAGAKDGVVLVVLVVLAGAAPVDGAKENAPAGGEDAGFAKLRAFGKLITGDPPVPKTDVEEGDAVVAKGDCGAAALAPGSAAAVPALCAPAGCTNSRTISAIACDAGSAEAGMQGP